MTIRANVWERYAKRLSKINTEAARLISEWIDRNGLDDVEALVAYAYGVTTKYGEAAVALVAEMYDAIAEMENVPLEPADPEQTPSYGTVRRTIYGVMKTSRNTAMIAAAVGRQVKKAGADTMLKNAVRDHAQYAWIAIGETCPFCLSIAAEGWKPAGSGTLKSEHIHGNCDCTYSVRHRQDTQVGGYDPEKFQKMFDDAEGSTEEEKLNYLRREAYAENKKEINAQKRDAYEKRKELNSSAAEEIDV